MSTPTAASIERAGSGTVRNGSEPAGGPFLTLSEAARLVGVSERAMRKRAERGTLPTRADVRAGKVVATVALADLERVFPEVRNRPEPGPEPSATVVARIPVPEASPVPAAMPSEGAPLQAAQEALGSRLAPDVLGAMLDRVRALEARLESERELRAELDRELATVRGQLAMSERVELAAQRAADRLEEKLETARREALSLARAIGQAEGDRDRVAALLAAPRPGFFARLLGRGSR